MIHARERATFIAQQVKNIEADPNCKKYTFHNWRAMDLDLPVIKLDNKYMAYSTTDLRTASMHFHYGREHPDAGLFFFQNADDEKVQKAQEEIMLYMVKNRYLGEAILENPVVRGREPVIITSQGFIVKGNFSVAILREIGEQMLFCVVLPADATQEEIRKFEDQY